MRIYGCTIVVALIVLEYLMYLTIKANREARPMVVTPGYCFRLIAGAAVLSLIWPFTLVFVLVSVYRDMAREAKEKEPKPPL